MARDNTRPARQDIAKSGGSAAAKSGEEDNRPNAVWFKPVMFGFMLLGLIWIIVFYVSQGKFPIPTAGSWNILIGFGIAFVGFLMTTRWR